jgi:chlorite dismutase
MQRFFTFVGGASGLWRVTGMETIVGASLAEAKRLDIIHDAIAPNTAEASWALRGIRSNERYVVRSEQKQLAAKQEGLGRAEATCAALIPIRKSHDWWALSQDERRVIFEEQSHHIQIGLQYLPAIARRLHHCRDISEHEPFDFLTWFEFAPSHESSFNTLLGELRASREWSYVEREIDIRLVRE